MFDWLKQIAHSLRQEIMVYRLVLRHPGTPRIAKIFLGLAVGYVLMPLDLIPDWIPVIGHMDDAVIVPALVIIAFKVVPKEVVEECRREAAEQNER